MKIRPVGAEMFHADGQRDGQTDGHDETNGHFLQFLSMCLKLTRFAGGVWIKNTAAVNVLHKVIILCEPHCLSLLAAIQLSHEIQARHLNSKYCSQYYVFTHHI